MENTDDIVRLYAALQALETADNELEEMHMRMDDVATELLQATAAAIAMRMRIRRLRNPYFKERMERFHASQDQRPRE